MDPIQTVKGVILVLEKSMDMNREFKNLIALENGIKELIEKNWENEKLYDRTLIILNYFQFSSPKNFIGLLEWAKGIIKRK